MSTSQVLVTTPEAAATRYSLLLTTDSDDVAAAQRLRHRVFADELGATLHTPTPGHDVDRFDAFCDHLVVREDATGEVVGTYRMLPPQRAAAAGSLYSDGEFDLSALDPIRSSLVETGRSCVAPGHRAGAVVGLVWAGIARYMLLTGNRWLVGCASVPLADGGMLAAGVREKVVAAHLAPEEYRVTPHRPWTGATPHRTTALPPLLRGYLRLGAWVCGEPAHDPDFDCADFLVLLGLDHADQRYLDFFLGER
ncbi:GNAT family N-acetyltransferase [Pseudonocardia oroxyli]|uniref:GNAT family N-acetyltransferase n=1 Tax=Pseudonocardia oroxyli TaxID=366584 RepID=UPI000B85449D|nr:GNAT family N-acyltransferase [Pseudonocardia oroxyli]